MKTTMKKELAVLLAAASATAMLTGCQPSKSSRETTEKSKETTTETTEEPTESEEPTEDTTETEITEPVETSEEPTEPTIAVYTGEEFQFFLDGLVEAVRNNQRIYYGPNGEGVDAGSMWIEMMGGGFSYTFTDVNADGQHELLIGGQIMDSAGEIFLMVDGFVTITPEGTYDIVAASFERYRTDYLGGGVFFVDESAGANLHLSSLTHYDATTNTLVIDAEYVIDSDEPDPSELPIMYYTLYEGRGWDYTVRAIDDPTAIHGEEAQQKWESLKLEAFARENELFTAVWNDMPI